MHPNSVHLSLGQKQYVLNRLEQEEQKCSRCGSAGWGLGRLRGGLRVPSGTWFIYSARSAVLPMVHLQCEECGTPIWYPVEGPIPRYSGYRRGAWPSRQFGE